MAVESVMSPQIDRYSSMMLVLAYLPFFPHHIQAPCHTGTTASRTLDLMSLSVYIIMIQMGMKLL